MPAPATIPIVGSIAPLTAGRKAWLTDIWGVMHNGVEPYGSAVAACRRFRDSGGIVLLLSNAPRPAPSVVQQLDRIGVDRSAYDAVLTSGDASRTLIAEAAVAGNSIGHLGPERDLPIYHGLTVKRAGIEQADIIVCTGLFDDETETPDAYAGILDAMIQRGAHMICANPDRTVARGGRIIYCAGAVAAAFEERGGSVLYAGKPYLPVYHQAFERLSAIAGTPLGKDDCLAIGDGVKTDIAGAAAAGVASVYIASAVHLDGALTAGAIDRLFPDPAVRPLAAMAALAW